MRTVRVIDPDGTLRIIDFATEEAMNGPELAAVVQARQERDRAQAAAKEAAAQWRRAIRAHVQRERLACRKRRSQGRRARRRRR
jgi:hypothetical protein